MKTNLGLVLFCCAVSGFTPTLVAQPSNDNYANRIVLSGTNLTVTGSNVGATTEEIEAPYPEFTNSVWWEWTAPTDGTLRLSATSDTFAPAFFVYVMDPSETNLFCVDWSANTPAETADMVNRDVRYLIAVGGLNGGSGEFRLALEFLGAPPNGTFATRTYLGSGPCRTNGWLFQAESGMAWYAWTAPADGPVTFRVPEENLVVSVLSGPTETNLQLLATSEARTSIEGAQATIEAQAGVTYIVRVAPSYGSNLFTLLVDLNRPPVVALRELPGSSHYVNETNLLEAETYDSDGRVVKVEFYLAQSTWFGLDYLPVSTNSAWPFQCRWTNLPFSSRLLAVAVDDQGARTMSPELLLASRPYNDNFTNRLVLTGSSVTTTGWFANASLEPSEPVPPGAEGGSVWFTWTAPFSGAVTMRAGLPGSEADTGIQYSTGVFTGPELSSLVLVTNGSSPLIFNVSAGTTYQVAIYTYGNPYLLHFSLVQSAPPTVQLISPAADTSWPAGSQLPITAEAADDGSIDHVDFYLGSPYVNYSSTLLGSVTNPPYTLLYSVPETAFSEEVTLRAVAFDNHGLSANSADVRVLFLPRPPPNDAFTNAILLTGSSLSLTGSVFHASLEPNEPNGDSSIWYSWTAPSSTMVTLRSRTVSSLAVFTGTAVDALTQAGRAAPNWMTDETQLTFAALAGVNYRIALCGSTYSDSPVMIEMIPSAPPAITLTSPTNNAKFLAGTPVVFSADASDPDGTLQRVDFFVDGALVGTATGLPYQTTVVVTNEYGTAWRSAWAVATDNSGLTTRSLNAQFGVAATPPVNDSFTNRIALSGSFLTVTGTTASATAEPGEPGHFGSSDGSVWWSWTAPDNGPVTLVLSADQYAADLGIYTGNSISNLVPVTSLWASGGVSPGAVTFTATAGVQYQFAVNWIQAYGGPVSFVLGQSPPPTVTITSPAQDASFTSGDPILLSADAAAPGGTVREVAFYSQTSGALLALTTTPPWSATIFITNNGNSSPSETSPWIIARATDSHGLIWYSEPRLFSVLPQRPANDTFANRLSVDGCSLVITGSTVNATYDGYPTGYDPSIWWSWTAPQDGWVTVDARVAYWSGYFGVFTGTDMTNLTLIASTNLTSYGTGRLAFPVTTGTAYALEAASPNYRDGADVSWTLHCDAPATVTITSPDPGSQFRSGSTILVSARVETPDGSRPNVEFYLDSALVQTLTNPPNPLTLALPPLGLGYHYLQVRAVGEHGLASWSPEAYFIVIPLPPANDSFANRLPVHGFLASVPANTEYATREPGEPDPFAQPDYGTLWYTWTAPASGTLRVQGDPGLVFLSLWTGSTLADLHLVATNAGWFPVETPVARGVTYHIAAAQNWKSLSIFLEADDYALITGNGFDTQGHFRLSFETLNQQAWVIEGSTDLQQWVPLGTNTTLRNIFEFVDEQSELYDQRFYRVTPGANGPLGSPGSEPLVPATPGPFQ